MFYDYPVPLTEYHVVSRQHTSAVPVSSLNSGPLLAPQIRQDVRVVTNGLSPPYSGACGDAWIVAKASLPDFGGLPIYLCSLAEMAIGSFQKFDLTNDHIACCGLSLSEQLEPSLRSHGCWESPGIAILFNPEIWKPASRSESIGLMIHEMAHWIHQKGMQSGRQRSDAHYQALRAAPHGPEYIRSAIHLRHRVEKLGVNVPLQDIRISHVPRALDFQCLLEPELQDGRPISQIIAGPPPQLFQRLAVEIQGRCRFNER